MRYTILGKTGLRASALGFGCMRLPMKDGRVDRDLSTPMLRKAVDLGVNIFDSAVGYCNSDSQAAIGDALHDIRDKVILSTKNHMRGGTPEAWLKLLDDSLRLLQTDHIDIYNIHGLNWNDFVQHFDPDKGGKLLQMIRAKEQGLIRHVAFSFHDTPENLVKLVDTGYFENVILQYNLLDQANADAMLHAREKGLGVVVMGPVGGGKLGLPSDAKLSELLGGGVRSTPEAALRFVWGHPAVNVALSGMGNLAMLEENVRVASETLPFTAEQIATLNRLVRERKEKSGLYCSGCGYCLPACPQGVQIPDNLEALNRFLIMGLVDLARQNYADISAKAASCIACGACLPKCPQKIDIPRRMRETTLALDSRAGSVACEPRMRSVDADGHFEIRADVVNFGGEPRDVAVTLTRADGAGAEPVRARLESLGSLRRASVDLGGVVSPGMETVRLASTLEYEGTTHRADHDCRFVTIRRGLDEDWNAGAWYGTDGRDFPTCELHGFRFKLSYDDTGLLLLIDVRDDFLFPSRKEDHAGMLIDCLEVFFDLRQAGNVGRNGYEPGVCQIFMYPGTPGRHPAFMHSLQKVDLSRISIEGMAAPKGYRIRSFVPYDVIATKPGVPRKMGFDIAADTADVKGSRIAQYVYAGGFDNWKDASGFREVWLV